MEVFGAQLITFDVKKLKVIPQTIVPKNWKNSVLKEGTSRSKQREGQK